MGARTRCTEVDIRDMGLHYAWHSELEAQETDVVRSPGYDEVNSQHATSRLAESRKMRSHPPAQFHDDAKNSAVWISCRCESCQPKLYADNSISIRTERLD